LYNLACVYAVEGLTAGALEHLDKAIQNGFGQREWLENDSSLDSIRDDPRFLALLRKL
jgi:adenylate cyclase